MARNVTNGVGRIGSKLGGGGGSGTITMTNPFTRATGISTDTDNNVTSVTLGEHKYLGMKYNAVGLLTAYNEIIDDNEKGFSLTYNASNLVTAISEVDPWDYYTVTPASASVNEGSSLLVTVTTNGPDGTYYWDTDSNDDVGTDMGSFTISGGTGTFTLQIEADATTEGSETLSIRVWTDGAGGNLGGTGSVVINDTSQGTSGEEALYAPGASTWTCPAGVISARVIVIGAGGAGGQYGGGGGGGASLKLYTNLVPGTAYNIQVGQGGQRSNNATGNDGTDTYFQGPGQTITGSGGSGGWGSSQGSGNSTRPGGSGTGGAINGDGGKGYPYHSSGWGFGGEKGTDADGTYGAGGGGGGGNDNGTGMTGGNGSEFAGGGGGGGADNGAGGIGGDGGGSVVQGESWSAGDSKGFGGGGGGTDGNNASGGVGGTEDGEQGQGQNTGTSNNNTGGHGGGPANNRGEKGVGQSQNAGGGGGGAFGGGGGGAGHSDPNSVAGAGASGLIYITYGAGVTESY